MTEFAPLLSPAADWLDVTYSPDDNPADLLSDFLVAHDFVPLTGLHDNMVTYRHVDKLTLAFDSGVLQVSTKYRAYRISASGAVLATLRSLGAFEQYLTVLASSPYRVTRLDAALDVYTDAAKVLKRLDKQYPQSVPLSRQRSLPTKMLISRRLDGARSGTWYAGHRTRARVTARVYDKTLELLDRTGIPSPEHITRYEFTFREGVANLNDAYNPASLFYAHCSSVVTPPSDAPSWSPSDVPAWVSQPVEVLPYEALLRRVSNSSDLEGMLELADRMGAEGRNALMHLLAKRLRVDIKGQHFKAA